MCTCQCCTSTPIKIDYKVTVQPMNVFLQHVLEYLTTELVKSTLQSSIHLYVRIQVIKYYIENENKPLCFLM